MAPAARPRILAPDNPRSQSNSTESISPDGRTQKIPALMLGPLPITTELGGHVTCDGPHCSWYPFPSAGLCLTLSVTLTASCPLSLPPPCGLTLPASLLVAGFWLLSFPSSYPVRFSWLLFAKLLEICVSLTYFQPSS